MPNPAVLNGDSRPNSNIHMSKPYSIKSVSKSIAIHIACQFPLYYLMLRVLPIKQVTYPISSLILIAITIAIVVTMADHDTPYPDQPIANLIMKSLKSKSQVTPSLYLIIVAPIHMDVNALIASIYIPIAVWAEYLDDDLFEDLPINPLRYYGWILLCFGIIGGKITLSNFL